MRQPAGFTPPPGNPAPRLAEDPDELLDEALRESFPASDPIAVSSEAPLHEEKRRPDERK